jgi:hypothetical protein
VISHQVKPLAYGILSTISLSLSLSLDIYIVPLRVESSVLRQRTATWTLPEIRSKSEGGDRRYTTYECWVRVDLHLPWKVKRGQRAQEGGKEEAEMLDWRETG